MITSICYLVFFCAWLVGYTATISACSLDHARGKIPEDTMFFSAVVSIFLWPWFGLVFIGGEIGRRAHENK